jgi:hypothetical protein
MAQYDVYFLERVSGSEVFVVQLQHDGTSDLTTVITAPLKLRSRFKHDFGIVNPAVEIGDETYLIQMEQMGAIQRRQLRHKVGNVEVFDYEITKAIDRLFSGI